MGPQIQPSVFFSASAVTAGSVLPCSSCPRLPIGRSCHSTCKPVFAAAAFITLTASGTTSSPMSSPSSTPIFNMLIPVECVPDKASARRLPPLRAAGGLLLPGNGRAGDFGRVLELRHVPAQLHEPVGFGFREDAAGEAAELRLEVAIAQRPVDAAHRVLDVLLQG